jgi:hypothetical protein
MPLLGGGVPSPSPSDPLKSLRGESLLGNLLEESDFRKRQRMERGYWNPPAWLNALVYAGVGALPAMAAHEVIQWHAKRAARGLDEEMGFQGRPVDWIEAPAGAAMAAAALAIGRWQDRVIPEPVARRNEALQGMRRIAYGAADASFAMQAALPEFIRQSALAVYKKVAGTYDPLNDQPVILPNAEVLHTYHPGWASTTLYDNQDVLAALTPWSNLLAPEGKPGLGNWMARKWLRIGVDMPGAMLQHVAKMPRGEALGLGMDILLDPSTYFSPNVGKLLKDSGLKFGSKISQVLEGRLRFAVAGAENADDLLRIERSWSYRANQWMLRQDQGIRRLLWRGFHLPTTAEEGMTYEALGQAIQQATANAGHVSRSLGNTLKDIREIVKTRLPGRLVDQVPDTTNAESVLRYLYEKAGETYNKPWWRYATRAGKDWRPVIEHIESLVQRGGFSAWDRFMEEGPKVMERLGAVGEGESASEAFLRLLNSDDLDDPAVGALRDLRDSALKSQWEDVGQNFGGEVRKTVEEVAERWKLYQQDLATSLNAMRVMGGVRRELLPAMHSFRSYAWHYRPEEMAAMLELSDPQAAAVLEGRIGGKVGPLEFLGIADSRRPHVRNFRLVKGQNPGQGLLKMREASPELAEALGILSMEESALLEGRSQANLQAQAILRDQIQQMAIRGMPGVRTVEEGWAWVFQGLPPEALQEYGVKSYTELSRRFFPVVHGRSRAQEVTAVMNLVDNNWEFAKQVLDRDSIRKWRSMAFPDNSMYGSIMGEGLFPREIVERLTSSEWHVNRNWYTNLVAKWRFGKAVWNLGGQARNILSNVIQTYNAVGFPVSFNDLRGIWRDDSEWALAREELGSSRAMSFEEGAGFANGLRKNFARHADKITWSSELKEALDPIFDSFGRMWAFSEDTQSAVPHKYIFERLMERFQKAGGAIVGAPDLHSDLSQEFVKRGGRILEESRLAVGKARELSDGRVAMMNAKGEWVPWTRQALAAQAAAEHIANKAVVEYSRVPPVIEAMRGYGLVPFIAFPYKALPITFQAALDHPNRFANWGRLIQTVENMDRQGAEERAHFSDWMSRSGYLRVPGENGALITNLSYLLPWGDMFDMGSLFVQREALPLDPSASLGARAEDLADRVMLSIPFANFIEEIRTKQSTLTGRSYVEKDDPPSVVRKKVLARLWMNVLPPALFGSQSTQEFARAWIKEWEKYRTTGKVPTVVGSKLVDLPAGEALLRAYDEFSQLVYKFPAVYQGARAGDSAPSLTTAAWRSFGLRALPFDREKQRESLESGLDRAEESLDKELQFIEEERRGNKYSKDAGRNDEIADALRAGKLRGFKEWYENQPYVRWHRYYYTPPSYGDQTWFERELAELEGSRE